jgi:hypothetical protein
LGGNNKIANASINLGNTKGRGSSTRMFNYCKHRSPNPSECINRFITIAPPPAPPAPPLAPAPPTPDTTILEYNSTQGPSFTWGSVTFTINTNLPNFSYTAITTSIPASVVQNTTILKSVTIGNSVTSIGNQAFLGCTGLTSVTFTPTSTLTSIGEDAFYDCGFTSIIIPNSVISIGTGAFFGCTGLTSVTFTPTSTLTSIGTQVFQDCTELTSIIIPNSVISIGEGAFFGCISLTTVTIGNSVETIGTDAFQLCTALTSITIGNSVTSIGTNAFLGSGLLTVTIANGQLGIVSPASGVYFFGVTVTTVTPPP